MKVKMVRVRWTDSCIYHDAQRLDADFHVAIMESVGFVLRDTNEYLALAGELMTDGTENAMGRRVIVIPKENIRVCKELK
jgi:hypothetical protein